MNILHLNIRKGIVPPALRRASRDHPEKRETRAPQYLLGAVLVLALVALPIALRFLAFVAFR